MTHRVMGVVIENRTGNAPEVQEILTKYGCIIKARIGLHETNEKECFNEGFIILSFYDEEEKIKELNEELNKFDGVRARYMEV